MALTLRIVDRYNPKNFMYMEPGLYRRWLAEPDHKSPAWGPEKAARRRELAASAPVRSPPPSTPRPSRPRPKPVRRAEPLPRNVLEACARGYSIFAIRELQRQGLLPMY